MRRFLAWLHQSTVCVAIQARGATGDTLTIGNSHALLGVCRCGLARVWTSRGRAFSEGDVVRMR